eukprot:9488169-Pyramimonas_sp.AAC.1
MRLIRKLPQSILLNIAGGESQALGSVRIACPKFKGGSFNASVMPETPCAISVGERCMDRGFSFFWPAGQKPYLLLPNGQRVDLTVEGKIPYLTLSRKEALGQWMCAVAVGGG